MTVTETMVLAGAKAIYITRSAKAENLRIDQQQCDEHFEWYEAGKSNPNSSVHYSNVAFALRDSRAALTAALSDQVVVPKVAIDWLNGEAPDADGKWFGECEDAALGPDWKYPRRYWWRSKFRAMIAAPPPSSTAGGGE